MSNSGAASQGLLCVLSAPSGTGKTTVAERLTQVMPGVEMSRSYTSRPARPGERDGADYCFISRAEFEARIAQGDFLEWAEVFGHLYGTSRVDTEARLATGVDLMFVIDVQGARQILDKVARTFSVFMLPPSFAVLEHRLRSRSHDAEAAIQRRLSTARSEVSAITEYDYVVVNDSLEHCVAELQSIILAERARTGRRGHHVLPIVATFLG